MSNYVHQPTYSSIAKKRAIATKPSGPGVEPVILKGGAGRRSAVAKK